MPLFLASMGASQLSAPSEEFPGPFSSRNVDAITQADVHALLFLGCCHQRPCALLIGITYLACLSWSEPLATPLPGLLSSATLRSADQQHTLGVSVVNAMPPSRAASQLWCVCGASVSRQLA